MKARQNNVTASDVGLSHALYKHKQKNTKQSKTKKDYM